MTRPSGPLLPQPPLPGAALPSSRLVVARSLAGRSAPEAFRLLAAGSRAIGLEAQVVGRDPAGRPLLDTPRGAYRLERGPDLEVGARLRLVPAAPPDRPASPNDRPQPARTLDPGAFRGVLVARADGGLAASLVRLLVADEMSNRRPAGTADPAPTESPAGARTLPEGWRMLPFVLTGGGDEALIRVFRRFDERPAKADDEERRSVQRVVFEVDWSQFGRTQIDLLVNEKRADARVRSLQPLPSAVAEAIRDGFAATLAAGGLIGTLRFVSPDLAPLPPVDDPLHPASV